MQETSKSRRPIDKRTAWRMVIGYALVGAVGVAILGALVAFA